MQRLNRYEPFMNDMLDHVLNEQLMFLYNSDIDCISWYISSSLSRDSESKPYGGIFVFYSSGRRFQDERYVVIQGITRDPISHLLPHLYPKHKFSLPRLNDLLQPVIVELAQSLDVRYILVNPVGRQTIILKSYFGYKRVNSGWRQHVPCKHITMSDNDDSFYYRDLQAQ